MANLLGLTTLDGVQEVGGSNPLAPTGVAATGKIRKCLFGAF